MLGYEMLSELPACSPLSPPASLTTFPAAPFFCHTDPLSLPPWYSLHTLLAFAHAVCRPLPAFLS
jgi:hypothetical protein